MDNYALHWQDYYDELKLKIKNIRKSGIPTSSNTIIELEDEIRNLLKGLRTIEDAAMQYEM